MITNCRAWEMSHATLLTRSSGNLRIDVVCSVCVLRPQGQRTFSFHGRQRQRNPCQCHLSNVGLRWWGFRWNLWRCQGLYQQSTKERHEVKLPDLLLFVCLHLAAVAIRVSPWICMAAASLAILYKELCVPCRLRVCSALCFTHGVQGLDGAFASVAGSLCPSLPSGEGTGAFVWPLRSPLLRGTHPCMTRSVLLWMGCSLMCVAFKRGTSE